MKVQNQTPLQLGWVVHKIEPPKWTGSFFLKGTFALKAGVPLEWDEEPIGLLGDVYAGDDLAKALTYPSDFAPFKPRADVLIKAIAHAPDRQDAPTFPVSIRVGTLNKSLAVFGARQWKPSLIGVSGTTPPVSVAAVPLTYENAFGGAGFAKNPLGLGRKTDDAPLVEDLRRPVRGPSDDADPAGFGPLPAAWPQRAGFRGTYDKEWLKTRWPWFPKDFDWSYFNAAPRDQQVDGYLVGNEEVELENMHPEVPIFNTRLPGLRPRCLVVDVVDAAERLREVPLMLDTLWIDVDAGKAILVWRGGIDVKTFKLREVERIVVAVETMADEPQSAASYLALPTAESEPPAPPAEDPAAAERWAEFDRDFAAINKEMMAMDGEFASMEKEMSDIASKCAAEWAKRKTDLIAQGVDPVLFAAPPAELGALTQFDQMIQSMGKNNPAAAAKANAQRPWIAQAEVDMAAVGPELDAAEKQFDADFAANGPERPKRWTREMVDAAAAANQSLAGENLAELDLHKLTLAGVDFRGAILAKANLAGCLLAGCDLREVDLTEADLNRADLSGANLDSADLTGAKLTDVTFSGVSLVHATLAGLDLAGANVSDCNAERADFAGANLAGAILERTRLTHADFTGANLEGARFRRAVLVAAQCEGVMARGIDCEGADLTGLHGSDGSDFTAGNFQRVNANGALFTASILNDANFAEARLARAQFDDALLRGAIFDRADLSGAMFDDADLHKSILSNANLLRATFDRANLEEADCSGSNFYEAGFWDTNLKQANLRGANLNGSLLRGTN